MKKTKCTLLFLYNRYKISPQPYYTENLGIQYIGGVLRNAGFDVRIINADYENLRNEQIVNLICENDTDFLGISPCYINMEYALDMSHEIKRRLPNINICIGGHHATFCCDEILKNEDIIDFIVRGEGEETSLELAEAIESHYGGELPFDVLLTIKGLSFRHDGKVTHNEARGVIEDLDRIPFPVRDPLDKILEMGGHAMPLLCISRGCPANCSFCSTPRFYERVWRARSAKNVVDEIQSIIDRYGFTQFYITDDQFAGAGKRGRDHVQSIIQEIKDRELHKDYNLYFFIMVRADFFRMENEDIIKQFPEVGFMDIFIGFESGDPGQIKVYKKGTTQKQYKEAIDLLRKYNIFLEGGFIVFNPYSTFISLRNDANLIRSLGVPLFGYYTKELMAYPGTSLFDELVQNNMFIHHSYKKIKFRYNDDRIGRLHEYVSNFFEGFEETDNLLFETIDFQAKLKTGLNKIKGKRLEDKATLFIKRSDNAYQEITDLNHRFFNNVLDIFEENGSLSQCRYFEQGFKDEYHRLFEPIFKDYRDLNDELNIIGGPIAAFVPRM